MLNHENLLALAKTVAKADSSAPVHHRGDSPQDAGGKPSQLPDPAVRPHAG